MLILFDQGTPFTLLRSLSDHLVATGYGLLITTDTNIRYQQNLTGRKIAILVLTTTSWPPDSSGHCRDPERGCRHQSGRLPRANRSLSNLLPAPGKGAKPANNASASVFTLSCSLALAPRPVTARKDVTLWKRVMPPLPRLLTGLFAGLLLVH